MLLDMASTGQKKKYRNLEYVYIREIRKNGNVKK